jgi:hypothetical protein
METKVERMLQENVGGRSGGVMIEPLSKVGSISINDVSEEEIPKYTGEVK